MQLELLNCDKLVEVDDDFPAHLAQHWWKLNKQGYVYTYLQMPRRRILLLHRAIMAKELKRAEKSFTAPFVVDHIDANQLNCTRANLRVVSQGTNILNNFNPSSKNKSGVVGVYFDRVTNRWKATCGHAYLGSFTSPADAIAARKNAVTKLGGRLSGSLKVFYLLKIL